MRSVALALLLLGGCKITTNAANPTALERQLVGAYDELDRDLVLAASVRGGESEAARSFASLRLLALEARALMRFNEDDVRELKAAGCVAEAMSGQLVEHPCEAAIVEVRTRVLEQENRARRDLSAFAAYAVARENGRVAATSAEIDEMRAAYHRLLLRSARAGDLVETSPGTFAASAGAE